MIRGKNIVLTTTRLTGICLGWGIEQPQKVRVNLWDPYNRKYYDLEVEKRYVQAVEADPQELTEGDIERIPDYAAMAIDLALATGDRDWFNETMDQLKASKQKLNLLKTQKIKPHTPIWFRENTE